MLRKKLPNERVFFLIEFPLGNQTLSTKMTRRLSVRSLDVLLATAITTEHRQTPENLQPLLSLLMLCLDDTFVVGG